MTSWTKSLFRVVVATSILLLACSGGDETKGAVDGTPEADQVAGDHLPDVVEAELVPAGAGSYDVSVTVSSPYDTPDQYADAWRVTTADGVVLGERTLAHDHANEQPFTRSLEGVEIPEDVDEVVIQARDSVNGYGGATVTVAVPR